MKKLTGWVLGWTCFFLALAVASGCDSVSGCHAGETRCSNELAQICTEASGWETWQDCGSYGGTCGYGPGACYGYNGSCCL